MNVLSYSPSRVRTRRLRLGFLSPHNAFDRRAFSGSCFHAAAALRARDDVALTILGHRPPGRLGRLRRKPPAGINVTGLDLDGLDAVVGLVATPLLAELIRYRPTLPFLHVTDATPAWLRETYGWAVPYAADAAETQVARAAAMVVYSSQAIADRAAGDLGLPGLPVAVAPFGLNLENTPSEPPAKPPLGRLKLLFVGIDWVRKGGDIAVAALEHLHDAGIEAELTVVGRLPAGFRGRAGIRHAGFLDKNRPRDLARLTRLYAEAHLLLLPTRADCTPMVLAEAMAHGTPVLATDTGGIGAMLGGAGTGRLMPLYAAPSDWARAVRDITRDATAYRLISDAAFEHGQSGCLSWDSWAATIAELVNEVAEEAVLRDLKAAIGT